MPTETDPRLPAAHSVDSPTARTPAVMSPPVVREYADEYRPTPSPALTDEPGAEVEPYPTEWATTALTPRARRWHADECGCDWGGDVEGHGGVSFEAKAQQERRDILVAAVEAGVVVHPGAAQPPVKAPVEAKVIAGAWSTLVAALVLAVSTAGLQHIDAVRALIGDNPWSGPAVLAVGVVLTAAQSWAAYQAPHSPRPTDGAAQ